MALSQDKLKSPLSLTVVLSSKESPGGGQVVYSINKHLPSHTQDSTQMGRLTWALILALRT